MEFEGSNSGTVETFLFRLQGKVTKKALLCVLVCHITFFFNQNRNILNYEQKVHEKNEESFLLLKKKKSLRNSPNG